MIKSSFSKYDSLLTKVLMLHILKDLISCMYVNACMNVNMWTACEAGACRVQKQASGALKLDLQKFLNHSVMGTESRTSERVISTSNCRVISLASQFPFSMNQTSFSPFSSLSDVYLGMVFLSDRYDYPRHLMPKLLRYAAFTELPD